MAPKKVTEVATWSLRTLYQCGKSPQDIKEMKVYDPDVLGIEEMRWSDQVNLAAFSLRDSKYHVKGVSLFVYRIVAQEPIEWNQPTIGSQLQDSGNSSPK